MMKKKNIYDDASLIKKSLIKDLSDKEQKELDQLLDDQSLQDVYKDLFRHTGSCRKKLPHKIIDTQTKRDFD